MKKLTPQEKISIYKDLFKGRNDVFASRWEKKDKSASGYTPVCSNEWKPGLCIKLKRGKCRNCTNQAHTPLTNYHIEQHLRGNKAYGIYPLLDDNTSFFLAADFDGKNWQKTIIEYTDKCKSYELPVYIERSRSGNGGHAWWFFETNYSASKSRAIAFRILKNAGIIDQFDKEDSFDRLFPNQDLLSGKGFGNLIALPLQGQSRKQQNTVFLNPANQLMPFKDQWTFLQQVKKISPKRLDDLYNKFNEKSKIYTALSEKSLNIILKNQVIIQKTNLPKPVVTFLTDNLNFVNSDYLVKKRIGLSIYDMEKYFKLIQTRGDNILIPRGFLGHLTSFLNEQNITFKLIDERSKPEQVNYNSELHLYDYQNEAIENMMLSENGILVAPPGSGKTMIGIDLITRLKQPALIVVHKKQIYNQWIERIEQFLSIPKREIGQFCGVKKKPGDKITLSMVQTLNKIEDFKKISDKFGLIIVDECHHMPAKMFRDVITQFNPHYLYGLTATPKRKHNDEKLIFIYLGDIIHTIDKDSHKSPANNLTGGSKLKDKPVVVIRETALDVPFNVKVDNFQVLSKILIYDSDRNRKIAEDIKREIDKGLKSLVLTERKEHVEVLSYYLKTEYEIITLTGDLTGKLRAEREKQINSGDFQVLIATGQLIGEGTDFPQLDCLFLVYPFSFSGKLTQYIGRIQRGSTKNSTIYDYRDLNIPYLEKLFRKRRTYYRKNFGLD